MGENPKIGRYEIRSMIGRGGMGVVYRAWDPVIGREVALKCLDLKDVSEPQAREIRERFRREAIAAGRLNHPNITMVFDVGEQEGEAFIAMEYIKGESLDTVLSGGWPLSLKKVVEIVEGIAAALDHAHSMGIVHRDIKPGNILIQESGGVKVTDFGIARIENLRMTQSGAMLGSPSYMSPEQILGKEIDRRSDVFSLGVILYIMLTGRKPFPGDSLATLSYRIVQEEPKPPSELVRGLDPGVDKIVRKALAKDPGMRYQQAGELAAALKETVGDADHFPLSPSGEAAENGESTLPTLTVVPLGLKGKIGPVYRRVSPFLAAILMIVAVALGAWKLAWPELRGIMASTGAPVVVEEVVVPEREYEPVGIVPGPYILWRDARKEMEKGNLENARKKLVELILLAPEDARAHLELGKIRRKSGDNTRTALQSYRRALSLDPSLRNDSDLVGDLISLLGTEYGEEASDILADMVGRPAEAPLVAAAAAGDDEKGRDALKTLVKLWRNRLKKYPKDVDTRLKVARGLYRLKEYEGALKQYRIALDARPEARKDPEIILNAVDLLGSRHHEEAYNLLVESIGPPALNALKKVGGNGKSQVQTRAREAVKGILARQAENEPDNPEAPLEMAYILEEEGEILSATGYLSIAVERKPSLAANPRVIGLLIKSLGSEKAGDAIRILVEHAADAAIGPLTEALASGNSDMRWNAARALTRLGQKDRVDEFQLWTKDLFDENTGCARKITAAGKLAEINPDKARGVIERVLGLRQVRRCGPGYFKKYLN